jgi:hypothetical protein
MEHSDEATVVKAGGKGYWKKVTMEKQQGADHRRP